APMHMDATSGPGHLGIISPAGAGCTATGQSMPARAIVSTPHITNGGHYLLQLANATSSATTVLAIGLTKNSQNIGWCGNLELDPLIFVMGQTDARGASSIQVPLLSFAGTPATD